MSLKLYMMKTPLLEFEEKNGVPSKIINIFNKQLLPVALKNNCKPETLENWFKLRKIPETREGYEEIQQNYNQVLNKHNLNNLSLTDPYWVKRRFETWEKINLYDNGYSSIVGDLFFTPWSVDLKDKRQSADISTNGVLRKRWKRDMTTRTDYLIKAGSKSFKSEPLNEILVSYILERLGDFIPYAQYDLCVEGILICCKCANFIKKGEALVTAADFYFKEPRDEKKESVYEHLIKMCDKEEITGAREYLEKMIVIDHLTGNIDRNLNNIGFIYDAEKGKYKGPAPLFDNGDCYKNTASIRKNELSRAFGDIEERIMDKYLKEIDLSFMKEDIFTRLIYTYPGITDTKRENLVFVIKNTPSMLMSRKLYLGSGK